MNRMEKNKKLRDELRQSEQHANRFARKTRNRHEEQAHHFEEDTHRNVENSYENQQQIYQKQPNIIMNITKMCILLRSYEKNIIHSESYLFSYF
ncbi:hypothetical protein CIRMBP1253_00499 [Enterococcus cecorum]|nr:hypothetical protein CIRMBP1275_00070 [Enterococcus cecorum]CAI3285708.1 hypothetical protein CIRMBP1253_00499 [Enterococcus cecorum]